jgi:hypothetical protein
VGKMLQEEKNNLKEHAWSSVHEQCLSILKPLFFGQMPKNRSKVLFGFDFFS